MAISNPVWFLGVPFTNQTFSMHKKGTTHEAAGWWQTEGAAITHGTMRGEDFPIPGHGRGQVWTFPTGASKIAIVSQATTPHRLTYDATADGFSWLRMSSVAHREITATASSFNLRHMVYWYDSSGNKLDEDALYTATGAATWQSWYVSNAITPPASAHHIRQAWETDSIVGGTVTLTLDFSGIGAWDREWNTGWWAMDKAPAWGTFGVERANSLMVRTTQNQRRYVDNDRYRHPFVLRMPIQGMTDTEKQELWYAWQMNKGRTFMGGREPRGGAWPVMVLPGGAGGSSANPAAPGVIIGDFVGNEFPLRPMNQWIADPPIWGGLIEIEERIT